MVLHKRRPAGLHECRKVARQRPPRAIPPSHLFPPSRRTTRGVLSAPRRPSTSSSRRTLPSSGDTRHSVANERCTQEVRAPSHLHLAVWHVRQLQLSRAALHLEHNPVFAGYDGDSRASTNSKSIHTVLVSASGSCSDTAGASTRTRRHPTASIDVRTLTERSYSRPDPLHSTSPRHELPSPIPAYSTP